MTTRAILAIGLVATALFSAWWGLTHTERPGYDAAYIPSYDTTFIGGSYYDFCCEEQNSR